MLGKAKDSFFTSENGLVKGGETIPVSDARGVELRDKGLIEEVGGGDAEVSSGAAEPPRLRDGSFVVGEVREPRAAALDRRVFPAGPSVAEGEGTVMVPVSPAALGVLTQRKMDEAGRAALDAERDAAREARLEANEAERKVKEAGRAAREAERDVERASKEAQRVEREAMKEEAKAEAKAEGKGAEEAAEGAEPVDRGNTPQRPAAARQAAPAASASTPARPR